LGVSASVLLLLYIILFYVYQAKNE
jgi:hypothetical protein